MKIAANSLEAFLAVARTANFSRAATQLAISQSALSQRVLNLESQLETTLFVRDRAGSRLTPEGEELLRYAQAQESLEEEFLASRAAGAAVAGSLRVGGFSSVTRSVVLPALAPIAREHLGVRLSLFSREMADLPDLLRQGEADLILTDTELEREGVHSALLGFEENVLVRSRKWKKAELFLDHDANDLTTQRYFQKLGPRGRKLERRFLDEVYNLIEGVKLGFGQAVVSRHLVQDDKELEIVEPEKVLKTPVWLHYPAQAYYPKVQVVAREAILAFAKEKLAPR